MVVESNTSVDNKPKNKISIERYAFIKETVDQLLVLFHVGSDYNERKCILDTCLELIKSSKNKINLITDEINSGFLALYVTDENKDAVIYLLNGMSFISGEEEMIFKINFYIPDNEIFYSQLLANNRSFTKMRDLYKFIPELNITGLKAMECERYMAEYQDYKNDGVNPVVTSEESSFELREQEVGSLPTEDVTTPELNFSNVTSSVVARISSLVSGNEEKDNTIRDLKSELEKEKAENVNLRASLTEKYIQLESNEKMIAELQAKVTKLGVTNEELLGFVKEVLSGLGMTVEQEMESEKHK